MDHKICAHCGYTGKAHNHYPKSTVGFIAAIVITMIVGLYFGMLYLTLIPAAATFLHLLKYKGIQCPKCDSLEMVSLRSNEARMIFAQGEGQPKVWNDGQEFVRH